MKNLTWRAQIRYPHLFCERSDFCTKKLWPPKKKSWGKCNYLAYYSVLDDCFGQVLCSPDGSCETFWLLRAARPLCGFSVQGNPLSPKIYHETRKKFEVNFAKNKKVAGKIGKNTENARNFGFHSPHFVKQMCLHFQIIESRINSCFELATVDELSKLK